MLLGNSLILNYNVKMTELNDISELKHENKLLRARNDRLEKLVNSCTERMAQAFGSKSGPEMVMKRFIEENL